MILRWVTYEACLHANTPTNQLPLRVSYNSNLTLFTTFQSCKVLRGLVRNSGLSRLFPKQKSDNMPATTAETLSLVNRQVSVAPMVLLSAADHYGRSAKGTRKRVVGVLLGQNDGKNVRVSNSFAGK